MLTCAAKPRLQLPPHPTNHQRQMRGVRCLHRWHGPLLILDDAARENPGACGATPVERLHGGCSARCPSWRAPGGCSCRRRCRSRRRGRGFKWRCGGPTETGYGGPTAADETTSPLQKLTTGPPRVRGVSVPVCRVVGCSLNLYR
jgi:hypothetical protein